VADQPGNLVWQRDLGTSLLFFGLFVMMLYVLHRTSWLGSLGHPAVCGGAYFGYLNFGHVRARVALG
jgi:cell division protein FtsW (lipid II flippase)